MLLHCHSRKCNTTKDHKLKLDTYDAICMDCGETNNMVSEFMKNAMKSSGDIYRAAQGRRAFMYKCPKCTVDRGVRIVDEQALCESCHHPLNLAAPMIEAIRQQGGAVKAPLTESVKTEVKPRLVEEAAAAARSSDDIEDSEEPTPKAELNKGVIKRHKE